MVKTIDTKIKMELSKKRGQKYFSQRVINAFNYFIKQFLKYKKALLIN
tara:strand:- start:358 stop:501 length:144 start_codon:yes stop_codon:yes gene_type:complete